MYRHVSLCDCEKSGKTSWFLLGPDGRRVQAFDIFVESIAEFPFNTRKQYCRHIAEAIDYLIESLFLVAGGRPFSALQLTDVIDAYSEYLLLGVNAKKATAKAVALSLPPGKNSRSSLTPKMAAFKKFLQLSDAVQREVSELALILGGSSATRNDALPILIEETRFLRPHEVKAMQVRSMLAGVLAGGPRMIKRIRLGGPTFINGYDESRAFPYDKVMDLIEAMPTYRDKCHYSLLAASGCRGSEGAQILLSDIDVESRKVYLVDPSSRPSDPSYTALGAQQSELLSWKGRQTDVTLLIEPFASAFFESLQGYLDKEYIAHGRHHFLFQCSKGPNRGAPNFLSDHAVQNALFHRVCKRIGVTLPDNTAAHSLRHTYGTYTLNFFPRSSGEYGLPLPMVQQVMGHASIESTKKYAIYDKDIRRIMIEHANRVIFQNGTPKKLMELKLAALEAQVAEVRAQLTSSLQ